MERRMIIDSNSLFFDKIYLPVCKQIMYPKNEAIVIAVNQERSQKLRKEIKDKYKFVFDYPEDNQDTVGIEVFYMGEVE